LFDLKVLSQDQESDGDIYLSCLEFDGAYMRVETGGFVREGENTVIENPSRLCFNLPDIVAASQI